MPTRLLHWHNEYTVKTLQRPNTPLFKSPEAYDTWALRWRERLAREPQDAAARRAAMRSVNPVYIPRNHRVEEALALAAPGDMGPFRRLLDAVSRPFDERPGLEDYTGPAPAGGAPHVTYCGT